MKLTKVSENHIAALLLAVAMCFSFFVLGATAAQAQETEGNNEMVEEVVEDVDEEGEEDVDGYSSAEKEELKKKHAAMKEQIESLRAMIAERKTAAKENHQAVVAEKRAEFQVNKADFMASLEGLEEEEKRAAMMAFIADIRAQIEAKKAEMVAKRTEVKEVRQENRDEFKASLDGLSREERVAAIMARVAEIKQQIEDRAKAEAEDDSDGTEDVEDEESENVDEADSAEAESDDSEESSDEEPTV